MYVTCLSAHLEWGKSGDNRNKDIGSASSTYNKQDYKLLPAGVLLRIYGFVLVGSSLPTWAKVFQEEWAGVQGVIQGAEETSLCLFTQCLYTGAVRKSTVIMTGNHFL